VSFFILVAALASGLTGVEPPQRPAVTGSWPASWVSDHCPPFYGKGTRPPKPVDVSACRVTESGQFGSLRGDDYLYAFYCIEETSQKEFGSCDDPNSVNAQHPRANIAVFVRPHGSDTVQLVASHLSPLGGFRTPRMAASGYGAVMELPLVLAASCDCNASYYYLKRGDSRRWLQLDWDKWQQDLHQRLPYGLRNWNDFWPDLQAMTARGGLWRPEDPHCCPGGGSVEAALGIEGDRFVLRSFRVLPPSGR
jgi:hypothetical protein